MTYSYITENNLYHKQTYMYSEYGGISFLNEYIASRQEYLNQYVDLKDSITDYVGEATALNDVSRNLRSIRQTLKAGRQNKQVMDCVNAYTKSFEVRKRIYEEYDDNWKPIGNKEFEDYKAYLTFAECLTLSYKCTGCLKYFNCLLKVDDTLLSVQDQLDAGLKGGLYQVIKKELDIFYHLVQENGISLEE